MKEKILFIGPISPPVTGPGVKNKIMTDWLHLKSDVKIETINTLGLNRLKLMDVIRFLLLFVRHKVIILSVSKNGRFIFIPICFILRKKVILFPAGGYFDLEIKKLGRFGRNIFLKTISCVDVVYSQTETLKEGLIKMGLKKVVYFPNPRLNRGYIAKGEDLSNTFKIVFLSKIKVEKGPLLLIESLENVRRENPQINIELCFYGVIENSFRKEFLDAIKINKLNKYCGIANPDSVQEIISKYNLFVLPTFYKGEGAPGALIEAMMTGIPIITTDFLGVEELILNQVDGIVIRQSNIKELIFAINQVIRNTELREKITKNVKLKAQNYDIDRLMPALVEDIELIKK